MRNATSMIQENMKTKMAFPRSVCNESGVFGVTFSRPNWERAVTNTTQGMKVRIKPRNVCWIVHGTASDLCSTNASSEFCITHYTIDRTILSVTYARLVSRKYVLYYLKQKEHQAIIWQLS